MWSEESGWHWEENDMIFYAQVPVHLTHESPDATQVNDQSEIFKGFGVELTIEGFSDSSAGRSMAQRLGVGKKVKRIEAQFLCTQNLIKEDCEAGRRAHRRERRSNNRRSAIIIVLFLWFFFLGDQILLKTKKFIEKKIMSGNGGGRGWKTMTRY